jgi:hypothetical protein
MSVIYVLDDDETWAFDCEVRKATEEDVEKWESWGVKLDDIISVVGDDFMAGESVYRIVIIDRERAVLEEELKPRYLKNYYNRIELIKFGEYATEITEDECELVRELEEEYDADEDDSDDE